MALLFTLGSRIRNKHLLPLLAMINYVELWIMPQHLPNQMTPKWVKNKEVTLQSGISHVTAEYQIIIT